MRQWYSVRAEADQVEAEIALYGLIGQSFWDDEAVSAKQFLDELTKLPSSVKDVKVRINSPGGSVFEGVAIANALRDQRMTKGRNVHVVVDGLAGSVASVIAMAGTTITMGDNALMFVHNPWGCICGSAKDMRQTADDFDKIRDQIITTYQWQSKLSAEEIGALLDAETWMDADEAIANGFATDKVEGLKAAAALDARAMARMSVPDKYRARVEALVKPTEKPAEQPKAAAAAEVLRICREGECLDLAEALVAENATLETVNARVAEAKQQRAAAQARRSQIEGLCKTAKMPELAAAYIDGGMSVAAVQAQLTILTAKLDRVEIDGGLPPDHGSADAAQSWKNAFARAKNRFGLRAAGANHRNA